MARFTGKKSKKTKGKTLALNDFLQENTSVGPGLSIRKTTLIWADEVENSNECDRPKANVILPTAPKASRGLDEYSDKIPSQPPYMAYLSNLPYDVNDDEIIEFFGNLKISSLRIPKDERAGEARLKGFGYVEFEDREGLIGALSITDCTLKSRRIRIEVATNADNDRRRGRMDSNRDRPDRSEITSGDWRSGPRSEPTSEMERGSRGGGGGGFNRDRENNPQERERGGSWRDSSDRPAFSRDGGSGGGGGGFNRDDNRRGGFGSRRGDRDDREFTRGGSRDEQRSSEPRTRPKLVLAPRTKPVENITAPEMDRPFDSTQEQSTEQQQNLVPGGTTASIFGNAKPVDTAAREREIEDKLAKEKVDTSSSFKRRDDWGRRDSPPRRGTSPRRYGSRRSSPDSRKGSRRGSLERNGSPRRETPPMSRRSSSPDDKRSISPASNGRKYSIERERSPEHSPSRRRDSPIRRRESPYRRREASPIRRGSPPRRRHSPPRRRESPSRRHDSPSRRRRDPSPRRPHSPSRRRDSPSRRRDSPTGRRDSPSGRRDSPPGRRDSPPRRRDSPSRRRDSPSRRRDSPSRRYVSPSRRRDSLGRGDLSPGRRDSSPGYRSSSPPYRKDSPTQKWGPSDRRKSPDRISNSSRSLGRKNDERDKKGPLPPKNLQKSDKERPKERTTREAHEKEMPKLKEATPPNFVASNKFSHLTAEDDSD